MDDYLDHLIYPPTWADEDVNERSSWSAGELGQPNVLLPTSLRLYEDDTGNSPGSVIGSSQHVECLAAQDTSSFVLCNEQGYDAEKGFIFPEAELQKDGQNCNGHSSPNGVMNGSLKAENVELQYAGSLPTTSSMNFCYSKQLPIDGCLMPSLSCTETSSVGCNGSEESEHLKSLINMQNLSSMQQFWPLLSYNGVSSLLPSMGLDSVQGSGMQEGQLNDGLEVVAKNYVNVDEFHHVDKEFAFTPKGNQDVQSCSLPSFAAEPNVTVAANQLPYLPQTTSSALTGGCNRNGKTRVRARRGQATDPHSIAERLRREKIAERMRNLQELVPNSSKVDKASTLDEIIDYVKFLQLQVKVLSMSRLGAAGAVIPLITDGQPEGNNTSSLSASAGMGLDPSPSPNQIAFEQEVLKLMESNVTLAMQYLQSKGLCLMPVALASAISSGKASLPGTGPNERKKFSPTNGFAHDNSSNSSNSSCGLIGIETHQYNFNMVTGRRSSDGIMANGSNGDVKEEQAKNA